RFPLSFFVFFFSSRRRHTRFSRDWTSDVCSSDLDPVAVDPAGDAPLTVPADVRLFALRQATFHVAPLEHHEMDDLVLLLEANERSEERRVGKECRARRSA